MFATDPKDNLNIYTLSAGQPAVKVPLFHNIIYVKFVFDRVALSLKESGQSLFGCSKQIIVLLMIHLQTKTRLCLYRSVWLPTCRHKHSKTILFRCVGNIQQTLQNDRGSGRLMSIFYALQDRPVPELRGGGAC